MRVAAADGEEGQSGSGGPLARRAIIGVTVVQALVTMATLTPAALAPALARALDVPTAWIGLQISLAYAAATGLSFFGGGLVRRWGGVRTSQMALVLTAAGTLLIAVPAITAVVVGTVLVGFGYGCTNPSAAHVLIRLARPERRNIIFSVKQAGQPLGGVLAGLIAPPLAVGMGIWSALLVCGGACLMWLVVLQGVRDHFDDDREPDFPVFRRPFADLGLVWRDRALRSLAGASGCFAAVQLSVTTFVVAMLVDELEYGLVVAGTILAAHQAGGVGGRMFWGLVADRLGDGSRTLMIVAVIASGGALACVTLSATSSPVLVIAIFALLGASAVGWNGVSQAEVARRAPTGRAGNATAGVMVPTFIGVFAGPPMFTLVHELTGSYAHAYGWLAVGSLAGLLLVAAARRQGVRAPADSTAV